MSPIMLARIIDSQATLILSQALEILELEKKLEAKEYNKRYTNTKFKKLPPTVTREPLKGTGGSHRIG